MFKKYSIFIAAAALALTVGCTPKKKADDAAGMGAGDGSDTAKVISEPMTYDSSGSDSGKIDGLQTVNFAYDSSSIDASGREKLANNAKWIKDNKANVQVEGHCDSHGSVEYNIALGERRAKSVKDYLVGLGVEGKRLTVLSYGKEKPLEIGDSEAVNSRNRRANFVPLK